MQIMDGEIRSAFRYALHLGFVSEKTVSFVPNGSRASDTDRHLEKHTASFHLDAMRQI